MNKEQSQHFIDKMKLPIAKLCNSLAKNGITFNPLDENPALDNVSFTQGDKVMKIAHACFYRHSGIAYVYKENKEGKIETLPLTDDMYMNIYMKSLIELFFSK